MAPFMGVIVPSKTLQVVENRPSDKAETLSHNCDKGGLSQFLIGSRYQSIITHIQPKYRMQPLEHRARRRKPPRNGWLVASRCHHAANH
jgi:hypothetical protein